ncbi:MAG: DUF1653 domain-containing protein [Clostridium sp.]|nr:DUF1653 domain-containing protein [Clostridium sp.]
MRQREIPKPGEFYRHFKMKYYQIIAVAVHSETREQMVVYQALYDDFGVYVRPLDMFMSEVDHEKYPEVVQKFRFERIERPCVSVQTLERVQTRKQPEKQENLPKENCQESVAEKAKVPEKSKEYVLDQDVERFLDADTYRDKLNILMSLKNQITEKQLHDIAVTLDVSIEEGDMDKKFMGLVQCLRTMAHFEVDR